MPVSFNGELPYTSTRGELSGVCLGVRKIRFAYCLAPTDSSLYGSADFYPRHRI